MGVELRTTIIGLKGIEVDISNTMEQCQRMRKIDQVADHGLTYTPYWLRIRPRPCMCGVYSNWIYMYMRVHEYS